MEGGGGAGAERTEGSCSCGVFDSAEDIGFELHEVFEVEVGDQDIQELSEAEAKAVLGKSFLVSRILCEHGRDERRSDSALCSIPRKTGQRART